jgi:hypothetical protein
MSPAGRLQVRRTAVCGGPLVLAGLARVPVEPDREQARRLAIEELSRREYQAERPGLITRMVAWLLDQLSRIRLPDHTGSSIAITVLLAVIVAVVLYALYRTGGLRRAARLDVPAGVFTGPVLDAAGHRAAADRHAARGEWAAAVLERFRAVARQLEERAIITPSTGRTAHELAAEAALRLPRLDADLAAAARTFDEVCYGHRPGTPQADGRLRSLDEAVRAARPAADAPTPGALR